MLNREMLKQQSIPVGDVDVIANAIDRQKVCNKKLYIHMNDSLFPFPPFLFLIRDTNPK